MGWSQGSARIARAALVLALAVAPPALAQEAPLPPVPDVSAGTPTLPVSTPVDDMTPSASGGLSGSGAKANVENTPVGPVSFATPPLLGRSSSNPGPGSSGGGSPAGRNAQEAKAALGSAAFDGPSLANVVEGGASSTSASGFDPQELPRTAPGNSDWTAGSIAVLLGLFATLGLAAYTVGRRTSLRI